MDAYSGGAPAKKNAGECDFYIQACTSVNDLLGATESAAIFNLYSGRAEVGVSVKQRLITQRNKIFEWNFNYDDYDINTHDFVAEWFPHFLRSLDRIFNLDYTENHELTENAWLLVYTFLKIRIFNKEMFFTRPTRPIRFMAGHCPAVLWRIITLHNCPDSPAWFDETRFSREYRAVMDDAKTVLELNDVKLIKKTLVEYYLSSDELDLPEVEVCEWLGFAEEDME